MRSLAAAVVTSAAVACGLAGCAAQMYDGPRRGSGEVALIEADGTSLVSVDGKGAIGNKLEVLSGLHTLEVRLEDTKGPSADRVGDLRNYRYSSRGTLSVCFVARPGHTYQARPTYGGGEWQPEIVDETTAHLAPTWLPDRAGGGCLAGTAETDGE